MTMTDLGAANLGTTTWRGATFVDSWNEAVAVENVATWSEVADRPSSGASRVELLRHATSRLKRLVNSGAASMPAAVSALRAMAAVLADRSATPQPSATDDRGVLIEWLVNGASLHMRLSHDGEIIETWALGADGSVVLDDLGPVRQFSTSPARLSAKAFLREVSSGVENRVAVDR